MKNKKIVSLIAIAFLAAGCNLLSQNLPAGVVKTVNGGADWRFSNALKGGNATGLSGQNISKLAVDPLNRQTVYASSFVDGLFKSEDAGANWSKVLSKIAVYDFVVNPQDTKVIYAAGFYADKGKVLKTVDGGGSWTDVPGYTGVNANTPSLATVRAIALNPLNPNQLVIGTADGNLNKSADGGLSWQFVKDFKDQINKLVWQDKIYVLLKSQGLFAATDLGASFNEASAGLGKTNIIGSAGYSPSGISIFRQLYVDSFAPNLMYLATDKGLYKTVDGKTWNLVNLPVKSDQANVRTVTVSKSSSNLVFSSVGSTIYKSLDGGQTWQTQGLTTAGYISCLLIDPQMPQIVYGGVYNTQ